MEADGFWITPHQVFSGVDLARLSQLILEEISARGTSFADEIDKPHLADERLLEFLLDPKVLDLVAAVCGPDVVLGSSHLFAKRPIVGKATPWHNDTAYLHRFLDAPERTVAVWISVDGSWPDNGCLRIIPGSHRLPAAGAHVAVEDPDRFVLSRYLPDINDAMAVDVVLPPGHVSLHHPSVLHSARPNRSNRPRTG
ncbi:phytanoyl-CoA dioxygenase family protein [Luedemannella flava]